MSSTEASRAAVAGTHPGSSLVRAMTRWDLTALATNGIIGAGIFGLPSSAAQMLGVSSPVAFVLCAIVVYVFVLCFAEAAGHFTETGGPYLYARTIFGPFIGFEVGWSLWLSRVSAFAANSNVLVSYLRLFFLTVHLRTRLDVGVTVAGRDYEALHLDLVADLRLELDRAVGHQRVRGAGRRAVPSGDH